MLSAAERLTLRPLLGRRQPEMLPDPFRFWSLPRHNLLLIYSADPVLPKILRVVRTDRDLGPILADLLGDLDEPG